MTYRESWDRRYAEMLEAHQASRGRIDATNRACAIGTTAYYFVLACGAVWWWLQ